MRRRVHQWNDKMAIDFSIRAESAGDVDAISGVHLDAFAGDARIPVLVGRLRRLDAPLPSKSFVAQAASGEVLGHVMISHSWLDAPDRIRDILVLSPLGVATAAHGLGIGSALLDRAVQEASMTVAPILFLEGNPAFYGPRGFEASKPCGIRAPSLRISERALQMRRLPSYTEAATGTLVYRDLWWALDCVGRR